MQLLKVAVPVFVSIPGNIRKFDDQVKGIAQCAKDHGVSIRIGVNAGSLHPSLLEKYGEPVLKLLVESVVLKLRYLKNMIFMILKNSSVKHHDPVTMS